MSDLNTSISKTHRRSYKHAHPFRSMLGLSFLALGLVLSLVVLQMSQDMRFKAFDAAPNVQVSILEIDGKSVGGNISSTAGSSQQLSAGSTQTTGQFTVTENQQAQTTSQQATTTNQQTQTTGQQTETTGEQVAATTQQSRTAMSAASSTNCPPGDKTCRNGYWYVCTSDGQSYQKKGACSNNDSDPSHGAKDCSQNEKKCDGTTPMVCIDNKWVNNSSSFAEKSRCGSRDSSYDSNGECKYGFARCVGGTYQICDEENGALKWVTQNDATCNQTAPQNGQLCSVGERACKDGKVMHCACNKSGGDCSWERTSNAGNSDETSYCASDFNQDANGNTNGVGSGSSAGGGSGSGSSGSTNPAVGGGGGDLPVAAPMKPVAPVLTCTGPAFAPIAGKSTGENSFSQWSTVRLTCTGANKYIFAVKDQNGGTVYYSQTPETEVQYIARTAGKYLVECTPVE